MDVLGFRRARAHARSRRVLILCAMTGVAALGASMAAAGPASAGGKVTVVASGLDNPRGLAFGPGGGLYVAEAGHGGSECMPGAGPTGGSNCIGFTSGISEIDASGVAHKIVSGFVSSAGPNGS